MPQLLKTVDTPTPNQIELRDPATLKVHRLLKQQPGEWDDEDPRLHALADDIRDRGIDQPLLITADGHLADGRNRKNAARRYQIALVPCKVVPDTEVAAIIVQSLLQRRHYTPGQRAYLLAPTLDEAFLEAAKRKLANLERNSVPFGKAKPSELSAEGGKTVEDWAATIGVSVRYLRDARKVWELFKDTAKRELTDNEDVTEKNVTLREFFEPRILREEKPYGLGAVVAGASAILESEKKGKPHKGGKPDDQNRQLELFNQITTDEINRWTYWEKFDDVMKAAHYAEVRKQAASIENPEQLNQMAEYHAKLAAEYRKAFKEAQATAETK